MKTYNTILTKKQQKYLHCQQGKLISINILHVKKYYISIKFKLLNKQSLLSFLKKKYQKNKQNDQKCI